MDVSTEINQILQRVSRVEQDRPLDQTVKLADLDMDSLAIMEAVYEIETRFGIEFDEDQLVCVRSAADLAEAVITQLDLAR